MTLQHLHYAITVSEAGSLNKAAEILYISQPSLTGAMQDLEKELGITIFHRSGRGMTLTNDGTGAKPTVVISEVISVCILTIAFIFAEPIVTAFGLGKEAVGYCTAHVRCVAFCLIPFASYFPLIGLFRGANNALYAAFVASSALAIRVVSTYALQTIPAISYRMVWWNALFGWGAWFYHYMDAFSAR